MAEIFKIAKGDLASITDGYFEESDIIRTTDLKYKFDFGGGNLKPDAYSFKGLNVLWVAVNTSDPSKKYIIAKLLSEGASVSSPMSQSDFNNASPKTLAATYDMVVIDLYVWGVWSSSMTHGKACADLGMIVVASGNDTPNNTFFTKTDLPNKNTLAGYISKNVSHIIKMEPGEYCGGMGNDANSYISALYHGAIPLYYHYDSGDSDSAMGFIYESENKLGGSMSFDYSGYFPVGYWDIFNKIILYQLSKYIEGKNDPRNFRYIIDQLYGSDKNSGNHWIEVEAYPAKDVTSLSHPTFVDENVLYQKNPTANYTLNNPSAVVNGIIDHNYTYITDNTTNDARLTFDIGETKRIKDLKIWHYFWDSRIYNHTSTWVSKDNNYWYSVYDYSLDGNYTESQSGKSHNFTGFNGNNSYVDQGLPIENKYSNLSDPEYEAYGIKPYSYTWYDFYIIDYGKIYDSTPHGYLEVGFNKWGYDVNDDPNNNGGGDYYGYSSNLYPSASTKYFISYFQKVESGPDNIGVLHTNNIYVSEYDSGGSNIKNTGIASSLNQEKLSNGWWRIWGWITTQSTTTKMIVKHIHYNIIPGEIRFYGLNVIKEDSYPRIREFNFDQIKRDSLATIQVPNNFNYGTIIGKFIPRTAFVNESSYTHTANQSVLLRLQDDLNTGGAYYRFYLSTGGLSEPFIDPDGFWGSTHAHSFYEIEANKEVTYVIQKTTSALYFKMYQNGSLKGTHTLSLSSAAQINRVIFGKSPIWNGTHTELTIYDEVLTNDELDLMFRSKGSIKKSGDVIFSGVKELGKNIWPLINLNESTTYGVHGGTGATYHNDELGEYHQMSFTNVAGNYKGFDIPTTSGQAYIFSGWFWQSSGNTFNYRPCTIEGSQSTVHLCSTWPNFPIEKWFYAYGIAISDGNMRFLVYTNNPSVSASGTAKWRNLSVREATPTEIKLLNDGTFQTGEFTEYSFK
jgi:hypothetical protein